MQVAPSGEMTPFDTLSDGACCAFEVSDTVYLGLKGKPSAQGGRSLVITLTPDVPDLAGPRVWDAGSVLSQPDVLHFPNVTIVPTLDVTSMAQWVSPLQPGLLLKHGKRTLLCMSSEKNRIGAIDLESGECLNTVPGNEVMFFRRWQLIQLVGGQPNEILRFEAKKK